MKFWIFVISLTCALLWNISLKELLHYLALKISNYLRKIGRYKIKWCKCGGMNADHTLSRWNFWCKNFYKTREHQFVKMVFAIFPYTHIYISCCRFYIHHQSLILSNLKRGKNWKCEHISFQTISTTIYADLTNFSVKSWWLCRWFGVIWEKRGNQVSKLFFLQMFTNEEIFFLSCFV